MTWDWEFKKFKLQHTREEKRRMFDGLKSQLQNLEALIKAQAENPTMEKGEIARLDDDKVLLEREIERALEGVKAIDAEIDGLPPSHEYPDGVSGVTQQMDALQELRGLYEQFMEKEL